MTDDEDNEPKPYRPTLRGQRLSDIVKQEITEPKKKDLFSLTINATQQQQGDNNMETLPTTQTTEKQLLIEFVFKPIEPGLKLHPDEIQLLLAHMGEILKEIEEEEKTIVSTYEDIEPLNNNLGNMK